LILVVLEILSKSIESKIQEINTNLAFFSMLKGFDFGSA